MIRLGLAWIQLAAAVVEFLAICAAANLILKQHRRGPWIPSGRALLMYQVFSAAVGWLARKAARRCSDDAR